MRPDQLLRKLKGRSAKELRTRAAQAVVVLAERAGITSSVTPISETTVRRAIRADLRDDASAAGGALRSWLVTPALLPAWRELDAAALDQQWPLHAREVIARADAAREGRADLLGYSSLQVGTPPNWHADPVSGRRAPLLHWSRVPFLDSDVVGDHKVIWELNRQQGALALAQAYRLTDDSSYATAAWAQIDDWITANPPKRGINWASSLELAFRIIAWSWTANLLRQTPPSVGLFGRLLDTLDRHGRHIEGNLSTWFAPNTHLTGEALGLYCLGCAWPELAMARHWQALGESILLEEFSRQIHADGIYYERTAWYHRYVVDFLLLANELAAATGRPAAGQFAEFLRRSASALAQLVSPAGEMPLIGDDDGGVLLLLGRRPSTDARPSLHAAGLVLGNAELIRSSGPSSPEAAWLLGSERSVAPSPVQDGPEAAECHAFADAGWYLLRGAPGDVALVDAGALGPARTGRVHSHASALALDVRVSGEPLLVDRGTGSYSDAALRHRFRDASMHNTVTIDGYGAALPNGPFGWSSIGAVSVLGWSSTGDQHWLLAEAHGFGQLGATHRRAVLVVPGAGWIVADRVRAQGPHTLRVHWHAAPDADIGQLTECAVRIGANAGSLELRMAGSGRLMELDSLHSPVYGRTVRAREVQYLADFEHDAEVLTVLGLHSSPGDFCRRFDGGWDVGFGGRQIRVTIDNVNAPFIDSPER